ncbi:universal stress protein [Microbispora hainanensis]|jgi:nucleotide-binding universal stress UspA family protein|uniref:Universal stress protein n=1 Tax=Microbispora hainanensis TaxID=568844 RepID=A0ABZ1T3B0_9ACTN|nr:MULTISPECIES: universal stress protein [Microbispora]NJP23506.1 universal stress protein [Microbispora sp. CL1-1]TQS15740.1 universal stress protein [Microbispora sp. SCL1-1]
MSGPIIVGTDGSPAATAAVRWAADDAARRGCPLRFVSVVDHWAYGIPKFPTSGGDPLTAHAERALAAAEAVARERQPDVKVSTEIIEGIPSRVLRDKAKEAVEIVLGSRGLGGFAGIVLGSVSTNVAGHAPCPVVVVRPGWSGERGEIAVGVDDSPECEPALAYAFEQARAQGTTLRAVHAWHLPAHPLAPEITYDVEEVREAHQRVTREKPADQRKRYPDVPVREELAYGHPVDALVQASRAAGLLVVGSHGRGAVGSAMLGSVSRGVLHHAECPVAVVRSPSAS